MWNIIRLSDFLCVYRVRSQRENTWTSTVEYDGTNEAIILYLQIVYGENDVSCNLEFCSWK